MSKDNSDFFAQKNEWTEIKDELLASYLEPYFMKILRAFRPLLYIDCFAGKGAFDDGSAGSPLIACEILENVLSKTKVSDPCVNAFFIEREYADVLSNNVSRFDFAQVINNDFTSAIDGIEQAGAGRSLFMYVDPYGIKHLDFDLFSRISQSFVSAEILMNFNSFGFVRAACRVYGIEYEVNSEHFEDEERDPWSDMPTTDASAMLSQVVGGSFWKDIIQDKTEGLIDGYEAERRIVSGLCKNFAKHYQYVLNIPVRLKESSRPKYRMIHLSNHRDGCLLMYDNMQKRLQRLFHIQYQSQGVLFALDCDNNIVEISQCLDEFESLLLQQEDLIQLEDVLAKYVTTVELSVPLSGLRNRVRELEKDGRLEVVRIPSVTERGKPTRFLESKGDRTIQIRHKS